MKRIFAVIVCTVLACCIISLSLHEPQNCPLCCAELSDGPCLIDLQTGEIGEIHIGRGKLSDAPSSSVFFLVDVAGCKGYCDTGARCCHIELQQKTGPNRWFMYCRSCRVKLRECLHCRYAILDLQQPEVVVYQVASGEFSVGYYQITVRNQTLECRFQF